MQARARLRAPGSVAVGAASVGVVGRGSNARQHAARRSALRGYGSEKMVCMRAADAALQPGKRRRPTIRRV